MCGIAGKLYFEPQRQIDKNEIKKMTDSMVHRGPDDEGFYLNKNIGLGFRRLSIIDLNTGHQPLSNSDETIWITFNGEIYNYRELRSDLIKRGHKFKTTSDTEVIVKLYEEYGEECVHFLRGMFAFVIWDDKKKQLFGARDRFGIKPFFYFCDEHKFFWASEIKALKCTEEFVRTVDLRALDYYFAYGYSPREQTIFSEIKKLEPATYFIIKPYEATKIHLTKYWSIKFVPDFSVKEEEWKRMIHDELKKAVELRMISDVPLGAFLSGGIDSSSVVALMAQSSNTPIKTFSIGFKEEKYNELKYARIISKKYNTEHHELIIEPESIGLLPKLVYSYDEPFADSSAIPTYYVSKFAREYVTVILSGDGGDELFAGYDSYKKMISYRNSLLNNSLSNTYFFKNLNNILPDYIYGKGYSYYMSKNKNNIGAYVCFWRDYERYKLLHPDINRKLDNERPENIKLKFLANIEGDFLSKLQGLDLETYLSDDILTKVDRVSMLNSLEVRVPILDHKLAELSFRIPSHMKLNKRGQKEIFKNSLQSLLPEEIMNHTKQGFSVPLKYWFRDDLKEYAQDTLTKSSKLSNYTNMSYVKKVLANHQHNMRDFSGRIWSLLFFNEWLEQNM